MNIRLIYFTKSGYENLKKTYDDLLQSRPEAVADLAKARAMGDLSENGYYKSARLKLSDIDRKLRQLKYQIQYGRIKEQQTSGIVDIGSVVTLQTSSGEKIYTIVGTYEANPSNGKISAYSPLGKVLINKKIGEKAILTVGDKQTEFVIKTIQ